MRARELELALEELFGLFRITGGKGVTSPVETSPVEFRLPVRRSQLDRLLHEPNRGIGRSPDA